jgi:hypothetical protein
MGFKDRIQFFKGSTLGLHEEQVNEGKLENVPKDEENIARIRSEGHRGLYQDGYPLTTNI